MRHGTRADQLPTAGPSRLRLDPVEQAVADIAAGNAVVVIDDADRENEGDLVFAAEHATPRCSRSPSGTARVRLRRAHRGRRRPAGPAADGQRNQDRHGTAYTVTVDAREGVTTGISARDRAHTIRLLADAGTAPADLCRPGTSCRCGPRTAVCSAARAHRGRSGPGPLAGPAQPAGVYARW